MSGTRVMTTRPPLTAPSAKPEQQHADHDATRLVGLALHQRRRDDAREGHHRADREVDPAADHDHGLRDGGQRERQDGDREALDPSDAVAAAG